MEFTLHYRGILKSNGKPTEKQALRRHFHQQLLLFWEQSFLKEHNDLLDQENTASIIYSIDGFKFASIVNEKLNLIAELNIIMLRPEPPGSIITQSGDIDNRLKTLFDALRIPKKSDELPKNDLPLDNETPFFCLLEDDNLITKISVSTDRLLYKTVDTSTVELLIHVKTKATKTTYNNIGFG